MYFILIIYSNVFYLNKHLIPAAQIFFPLCVYSINFLSKMFEPPFSTKSHSSHGGDSFGSGCKNFCEFHNLNRDNIPFQNDVQPMPTRKNNAKYDVNAILQKAGYVIIGYFYELIQILFLEIEFCFLKLN